MESPIYNNIISMLSNRSTYTDDQILKYIMKYLNPDIYTANIWITPQNICNIIKKALLVKKEFICIKLIKMYQTYIPKDEFNTLLYTDLFNISISTKNKDMLIWLKKLTSTQEISTIIDNTIDNIS